MYHSYFGLDEQAFSISVNPRYLYMSTQHREALAHLLYGVNSGGFVMLTGEVGTGKTTIIRALLEQLPDTADLAVVMNPSASARDLLCSICDEFGIEYAPGESSTKVLTDSLFSFLAQNHGRGRKSIVLIDEAQLLRVSTLEQVRLLTNLETTTQKLLQIILVGQPELNELLAKPALRQLSQRITARYHLRPLKEDEVEAYIKHRLRIAGMPAGRQPFPPVIIKKVFQVSRGIPRIINVLCDRMLLGAYSREATHVDGGIYRQARMEVLGGAERQARKLNYRAARPWFYLSGGLLALLVLSLLVGQLFGSEEVEVVQPQQVLAEGQIVRPVPVAPAAVAPSPATVAERPLWLRNNAPAMAELLSIMGIDAPGAAGACQAAAATGYSCEKLRVSTWDEFQAYNRPAVLTITTPSRHIAYVPVVAVDEERAWIQTDGALQTMPLGDLGQLWTGEFEMVWQRPPAFTETLGLGTRGAMVTWLAQRFAELDRQSAPLTREHFNAALQTRVKLFQQSHGLQDDGLVGMQTLLKMNEVLGLERSMSELQASLALPPE